MTAPSRRFANDDEAAQHWLTLLREGDTDQKIQAREQLAAIFERRGMFEEACDLLIANVRDGVRNAAIFQWLERLYRARGDEVTAVQAAAEAAKYLPSPPTSAGPLGEPTLVMAAPVQAPETERPYLTDDTCLSCGYVNRNARSSCKRCRAPLGLEEAMMPTGAKGPRRSTGPQSGGRNGEAGRPRPWYLRTPTILLVSGFCLPPLALLFVWLRPWPRHWKVGATIPLALWTLLWLGVIISPRPTSSPPTASTIPTPTVAAVAKPQPAPAQQPTSASVSAKPEPNLQPLTSVPQQVSAGVQVERAASAPPSGPTTAPPAPTATPQMAQASPKPALPDPTPPAPPVASEPARIVRPDSYQWVSIDQTSTPNRLRFKVDLVVPVDYGDDQMVLVFKDAVNRAFRDRPLAKAVVVFGYSSQAEVGRGADKGKAEASSDRLGWAGDGKFDSARDEGLIYMALGNLAGFGDTRRVAVARDQATVALASTAETKPTAPPVSTPATKPSAAVAPRLAINEPPAKPTSGRVAPQGSACPSTHPIKGNDSSSGERIYHIPSGAFYGRTQPEGCFATEADARAAGYRASPR